MPKIPEFNTLYHGEADDAASALDLTGCTNTSQEQLSIALVNALRRIAVLERQLYKVQALEGRLNKVQELTETNAKLTASILKRLRVRGGT